MDLCATDLKDDIPDSVLSCKVFNKSYQEFQGTASGSAPSLETFYDQHQCPEECTNCSSHRAKPTLTDIIYFKPVLFVSLTFTDIDICDNSNFLTL